VIRVFKLPLSRCGPGLEATGSEGYGLIATASVLADSGERPNIMQQHFIPRDATVAELEQKAADAEEKATNESEPRATELREEAKLYREWATSLRTGRWTS